MRNKRVRIAITGASGRMGKQLIQIALKQKNIILGAVLANKNSSILGKDVGEIENKNKTGVIVESSLEKVKNDFDILIDFTSPKGTLRYLNFCRQHNKAMIIGTTGFNEKEKKKFTGLQAILRLCYLATLALV